MPQNQAAWLDEAGKPLRIGDVEMPQAGPDEVVIRNHAVAINPIDVAQAKIGLFLKTFPTVLGQDVAGEIFDVGPNVTKFKKGDRVVAHAWTMTPQFGQATPAEAAFNLYTKVKVGVVALVPSNIAFTSAAVLPLALDTAIAGLYQAAPKLALPAPTLDPKPSGSVLVVYGGSSSVGLCAIQLAVASGIRVITIASPRNHVLCKEVGASHVFDYKDANLVDDVVKAVGKDKFVGIYDAISEDSTYKHDIEIATKLGGGRITYTHQVPEGAPAEGPITFSMVFGLGDFAFPVWDSYVQPALASGQLRCLPEPIVVGKGLNSIEKALERHAAGVSAAKVVVEL